MPVFLNYRDGPRAKQRTEARRSRKVASVADKAAAAHPEASDSGIATPLDQSHRPWLVPGVGKL